MSRPLRIEYPGAFYHVMNRGANHSPVFLDSNDRSLFLYTLADAVRLWRIRIHAYALMNNHYHLNGVRAGLYSTPAADPNTSHRFYLGLERRPFWLVTELALSYFGPELGGQAVRRFDQFVQDGTPTKVATIFDSRRWPAVLGGGEFIEFVQDQFLKGEKPNPDKPQEKALWRVPSPHEILGKVAVVYGTSVTELMRRIATKRNDARRTAINFLRYGGQLRTKEIGQLMGGVTPGHISSVMVRRLQKDARFRALEKELFGDRALDLLKDGT